MKTIILAAGGTGGHVFPAFAVAEVLRAQGHKVLWATDQRGLKYLGHWPGPKPLLTRSASPASKLKFVGENTIGVAQAMTQLVKLKPHIVVGFGGYPSVPMVVAAQAMGVPTIIHQSDAVLGLANKVLARNVKIVAGGFALSHPKTVITGNPVRPDIAALADAPYPSEGQLNVVVFGGSLGAKLFETIIPDALAMLSADRKREIVLTQQVSDETARAALKDRYNAIGIEATLVPFIDDMAAALAGAHLVISRSGAATVAELTAIGRPAVFIPLTIHADRQQYHNAQIAVDAGGAILIDEKDGGDIATARLSRFLEQKQDLAGMAAAMKTLGRPKAAWTLADLIVKTAG